MSLRDKCTGGITMKKVILAVLVILVLSLSGCGGGGENPAAPVVNDLAGLVGAWDIVISISGQMIGTNGVRPFNETLSGSWVLQQDSITGGNGTQMVWSYNGTTLTIVSADSNLVSDPLCGNIYTSSNMELQVPVTPGATTATIGGTVNMSAQSDFCGSESGLLQATGTMTRQ